MPLPALPPGVAIGTLVCFFKGDDAVAMRLETPRFNDPARPRTADSDLVVMVLPVEAFLSVVVVVVAVGDLTSSESLLRVRSVRAVAVDDDGPLRNLFKPLNDEPARSSVDPVDVRKADMA